MGVIAGFRGVEDERLPTYVPLGRLSELDVSNLGTHDPVECRMRAQENILRSTVLLSVKWTRRRESQANGSIGYDTVHYVCSTDPSEEALARMEDLIGFWVIRGHTYTI